MTMKTTRLLILVASAFFIWPHEASAARFVRASVSFDGKVILTGSTSDDGHADADTEQRERELQRMPEEIADVGAKRNRDHRLS